MLTTNYYHDQEIFDQEQQKIFLSKWIFFGLVQEFGGDNSYVRKDIAGNNVFLIKDQDDFIGFLNRCPHRFHPIVTGDSGLTNLVCAYHYWAFSGDGKLKGIPYENACYQFSEVDKNKIGLTSIAVKKIGSALFINFYKNPDSIERQFHKSLINEIESLSSSFNYFKKVVFRKKFNWKLIQENLRDGLHPAFLHQNTLLSSIKFSPPAIPKDVPIQLLSVRDLSYGGPDVPLTQKCELAQDFHNPWSCEPRYYNYHLFPSLHIAAPDGGYSFVLENFIPISPQETEIEIYFVLTKSNLSEDQVHARLDQLVSNALKVYEENFEVLENIQKTIIGSVSAPKNGVYEHLITRFHKGYLKILGLASIFGALYIFDAIKIPSFLLNYFKSTKTE